MSSIVLQTGLCTSPERVRCLPQRIHWNVQNGSPDRIPQLINDVRSIVIDRVL
jgi:hypothetical protein